MESGVIRIPPIPSPFTSRKEIMTIWSNTGSVIILCVVWLVIILVSYWRSI